MVDELAIQGVNFVPSVFINEEWLEDYWYLQGINEIDCWCRNKSDYNPKPRRSTGWYLRWGAFLCLLFVCILVLLKL